MKRAMTLSGVGMVTSVGFTALSSAIAMRAGLNHFQETEFFFGGQWVVGAEVSLDGMRGLEKLLWMTQLAIEECLSEPGNEPIGDVPLLLCVADADRPGAPDGDALLLRLGQVLAPRVRLAPGSAAIAGGRTGGVRALAKARSLLAAGCRQCLIAGVDSYLSTAALQSLFDAERLAIGEGVDGIIPGEAAGAVLLTAQSPPNVPGLHCHGLALANEPAPFGSDRPFRAEGLFQAIRGALADAGCTFSEVDYRISDLNGEPERFKESSLGLTRAMRVKKATFDLWSPAESIGEVGAASVPIALALARESARMGLTPGPGLLCHFSNDGAERGAVILREGG